MTQIPPAIPAEGHTLEKRRVLVVEDDYMIGLDMIEMLQAAGAVTVGPIGWVEDALALLAQDATGFDIAMLDLDLHGTRSYAIADALIARGVPILFTTGFDSDSIVTRYRVYPRLEKPISQRGLLAALAT